MPVAMNLDMFLEILCVRAPFFVRPLLRPVHTLARKGFISGEYEIAYKFLHAELGDNKFFGGNHGAKKDARSGEEYPGKCDFMLIWPVSFMVQRGYVDLGQQGLENVKAWYERCLGREGWKEGIAKGNGYTLKGLG